MRNEAARAERKTQSTEIKENRYGRKYVFARPLGRTVLQLQTQNKTKTRDLGKAQKLIERTLQCHHRTTVRVQRQRLRAHDK